MTDKATLVFHGFLKLNDIEKNEVMEEINKYYKADTLRKGTIYEGYREKRAGVVLGPTTGFCPCCGR